MDSSPLGEGNLRTFCRVCNAIQGGPVLTSFLSPAPRHSAEYGWPGILEKCTLIFFPAFAYKKCRRQLLVGTRGRESEGRVHGRKVDKLKGAAILSLSQPLWKTEHFKLESRDFETDWSSICSWDEDLVWTASLVEQIYWNYLKYSSNPALSGSNDFFLKLFFFFFEWQNTYSLTLFNHF